MKNTQKLIAQNKKAYHEYFIIDTYQSGIVLVGTEVKSLRQLKCSLVDSFIKIENGEAYVYNMHISPYEHGNIFNKEPMRKRKLLLHKKQIKKLFESVSKEGNTIVPVRIYFSGSYVKLDIALAKGKKLYDKRDTMAKKDMKRELERELKDRNR